jgi:hypothetical protein
MTCHNLCGFIINHLGYHHPGSPTYYILDELDTFVKSFRVHLYTAIPRKFITEVKIKVMENIKKNSSGIRLNIRYIIKNNNYWYINNNNFTNDRRVGKDGIDIIVK